MITNSKLTIYHKTLDETTRLEKWERHNYDKVWFFGGKGAGINKGYDNANNVDIRIPYNSKININNINIGDILVISYIEEKNEKGFQKSGASNVKCICFYWSFCCHKL